MFIHILFLSLSVLILYFAAHWLVSGASRLGLHFRIPPLVIGLTVVAFGTSAPELVVSITAALKNIDDIAVGNVVGSNIVNITLILGLAALSRPITTRLRTLKIEAPIMVIVAVILLLLSMNSVLGRLEGIFLTVGLIVFIFFSYRIENKEAVRSPDIGEKILKYKPVPIFRLVGFVITGIVGLAIGAQLMVTHARIIALDIGISERIVGLTIVAVGTSLPELATSTVAAIKGEGDISVGNLLGSNVFNVLAIIGITAIINPISLPDNFLMSGFFWDYLVMICLSILIWVLMWTGYRITRFEGGGLVLLYIGYIIWMVTQF